MSHIQEMADAFETQALGCFALDAPLYGRLNEHCAANVRAGGPVGTLISGWRGDPRSGFLPLRVLGAVHALVLAGEAPDLGRFYPSVAGSPQWPDVWEAFRCVVATRVDRLRPMLDVVPQTNEVQRSAALLAGFLSIAERTQLPLRLRELGSSAGLNLLWDRYRYELGPHVWGDSAATVVIRVGWEGSPPPLEARAVLESRRGCDIRPIRLSDVEQRRRLEAYVWPEHVDRLQRLRAAMDLALLEQPDVAEMSAAKWLGQELAEPADHLTTVIFHSSMWVYLPQAERERVVARMQMAGRGRTPRAPLAWLRLEDGPIFPELRLQLWPSGDDLLLADAHPHGRWVRWHGVHSAVS